MSTHNTPLIRQLGLADRDTYFELRLRGLNAHPETFGQSYREALDKGAEQYDAMLQGGRAADGDFLLGAYLAESAAAQAPDDAPLVGVVGMRRLASDKERHKATVIGMYVAPEAAGRRVGRALLGELLARAARIEGLQQIQLLVASQNDAAHRLYESQGFRAYGREIGALNVDGVFYDADLMALFL
jgi:RimJ/RimL family protein N-acetyltransferase